jgi:hypothetical protein
MQEPKSERDASLVADFNAAVNGIALQSPPAAQQQEVPAPMSAAAPPQGGCSCGGARGGVSVCVCVRVSMCVCMCMCLPKC